MNVPGKASVKEKRARSAKCTAVVSLGILSPAVACCVFLLRFYLVREALTFVGVTALVVFLAVNVVVLGILFCEASRKIAHSIRKARANIIRQKELTAHDFRFRL